MERWYYYRLASIWIRRNPWKGIGVVALIAFGAGLVTYNFLDQYQWGQVINRLILTMLSNEASSADMYNEGLPFKVIVGYMIVADTASIFLDLFVVNRLLAWKFFRSKVDWVNQSITRIVKKFKGWWPLKRKKSFFSNGITESIDAIRNHFEEIKKNPSKAGISAVALLGLIPRLPFMVVGGVSFGVFIIRYNKFGFRGWIALLIGIVSRNSLWLASLHGISSIF